MTFEQMAEKVTARFGEAVRTVTPEKGDPWIEVSVESLHDVLEFCRDDVDLGCDMLADLSGVDWLIRDERLAKKLAVEPHLQLVYHLFSLPNRHRLSVKVKLERWRDGKEGQLPRVPTISDLWGVANWHEREIYDLLGVEFVGHPDPRRILCAEDWVGHPLRKDYDFPLEYRGIRCRAQAEGQ